MPHSFITPKELNRAMENQFEACLAAEGKTLEEGLEWLSEAYNFHFEGNVKFVRGKR